MMVKNAYEEGYKRLNRKPLIGLAIFQACKLLNVNIFQSFIGKIINITDVSIRTYRKLYRKYNSI